MTVYVVSSGCYSEYSIDAIFSTKEKAEAFSICSEDRYIDEYELDTVAPPEYVGVQIYKDNKYHGLITGYFPHAFMGVDDQVKMYFVKVKYNPEREVMVKSAYDKIAAWKAAQDGIS